METSNYYEERSKKTSDHKKNEKNKEGIEKTEDLPAVIKNVMADAGIAVLGGGFTSAILGRLSLPVGLLLTGYGHYKKNNALRTLGIGIMASSTMTNRTENNPKATFVENTTSRIKAFADELKAKLSLDLLAKLDTPVILTPPPDTDPPRGFGFLHHERVTKLLLFS